MDTKKLQLIFVLMLLLSWTWELAANNKLETHEVKVAIILDHPNADNTAALEVANRQNETAANSTRISLRSVPIYLGNASFLDATSEFCSRILQSGVSVVVLQTQSSKHAHMVAGLSSHFKLPVVGDANPDPLLPDKVSGAVHCLSFSWFLIISFWGASPISFC